MLTSDMALLYDYNYWPIVRLFANDTNALNTAFSEAWAKLMTSGGKWSDNKKCIPANKLIPIVPDSSGRPIITNKAGNTEVIYQVYISNLPSDITVIAVKMQHHGPNCDLWSGFVGVSISSLSAKYAPPLLCIFL